MKLYTLDVGQGAFGVLVGENEAIIIDSHIPSADATQRENLPHIRAALPKILKNKFLKGLIITGFDSDHFDIEGVKLILNRYRPAWIVYPQYFKETENAKVIFNFITEYRKSNAKFQKYSIRIDKPQNRLYQNLSDEWDIEFFSPHWKDMTTSNNCSLVAKVTAKKPQKHHFSYLITGDTENDRWDNIIDYFSDKIQAEVLAAPHHGSKNATHEEAIKSIAPTHVLISAGYKNQYGHPHEEALKIYKKVTSEIYLTARLGSFYTYKNASEILQTTPIDFELL